MPRRKQPPTKLETSVPKKVKPVVDEVDDQENNKIVRFYSIALYMQTPFSVSKLNIYNYLCYLAVRLIF